MLNVEHQLFGAQRTERALQRCDIELGLAAELLIDHPRIGSSLLDDAGDATAGVAVGCELRGGRAQNLGAVLVGGATRTPARLVVGPGEAVGHIGFVVPARLAQRLATSSSARSRCRPATIDRPMGQPSIWP